MTQAPEAAPGKVTKLSRAERNVWTKRKIFDAATKVVGKVGYAEASVARITEEAGVAQGTFYNHFDNRQELLDQLLPKVGTDMVHFIRERRGIGAAKATLRAEQVGRVVRSGIAPEPLTGTQVVLWPAPSDVANESAVVSGITDIEAAHGPIAGLVNAAGVFGKMRPIERVRMDQWDREVNIDLRGTFLVARSVGVKMAARRQGAIVNVASVAGMTSGPIHAYTAAQAGVIQITQPLAAEWGRVGVRVNAVSPGFTRTVALEAGIASGALNKRLLESPTAMNRLVEPLEVAQAIAWLLSPMSSGVTGINLPVDAGYIAGTTWAAYGGLREAPDA